MPDKPQNLFAIYGALRSGTTVLRLMLDGHPELHCPSETDFLFDHLRADASGRVRLDREALKLDRIYLSFLERESLPVPQAPDVDALVSLLSRAGQSTLLVLHRNIAKALSSYPEMRIIHLLRDPRDVARSSIGMGWAGDVYHGVGHWIETETEWRAVAPGLAGDQVLTVHYEELIGNAERELTRICDFLGVSYRSSMLDYDARSTYSKPDPALIYQWKHKLSARDLALVEGRVGDLLEGTGYKPSGVLPHVPDSLHHILALKLANRRAIWRTRIQRYGLRDSVLLSLANRLRIPVLAHGAKQRINEKAKAYLK